MKEPSHGLAGKSNRHHVNYSSFLEVSEIDLEGPIISCIPARGNWEVRGRVGATLLLWTPPDLIVGLCLQERVWFIDCCWGEKSYCAFVRVSYVTKRLRRS